MEMRGRKRGREERDGCVGGRGDGNGSAGWTHGPCVVTFGLFSRLVGCERMLSDAVTT